MMRSKLFRFAQNTLLACIAVTVAGVLSAYVGNDRELLAPTGSLRVGVYPGSPTWGLEHMAIAVPKGHEEGAAYVEAFVKEVQSNGLLEQLTQKAGLRGAVNY